MDAASLKKLFEQVKRGKLSPDEAVERLRHLPFEDLGFANIDHHRALRAGMPEIIFGPGKTPQQIAEIFARLAKHGGNVLATRVSPEQVRAVKRKFRKAEYHELARALTLTRDGSILVKARSSSSPPALATLPSRRRRSSPRRSWATKCSMCMTSAWPAFIACWRAANVLTQARVIVVCAGMEGALPSVVGGMVGVPVIAVPTSVGYGASYQGIAALLGMLNSCASNVTVVNIDNGFGAGYVASMINRLE